MSKDFEHFCLAEWIEYLENLHPVEIQLGLSRIKQVAQTMACLTPKCKVITVAGTNGKGSTVAALEAIYCSAGYQVASYTSPHLIHFNERIRINSIPISDQELCRAFHTVVKEGSATPLTYFEIVTLAALWHFSQLKLDLIILEVGLGGRQDATNIIDSDLAMITTIDFDHQDFLGDSLDAIGYEKAGILRKGKKFIYADSNPPASIVEEAKQLNVQAYQYGRDYFIEECAEHWTVIFNHQAIQNLPKPGIQLKAAASAVVATQLLQQDLPIDKKRLPTALEGLSVPGRLHYIAGTVNLLFDVAHNKQAALLLAECVKKLENKKSRVHAVFSALKDKDIFSLINPLKDCVCHWYPAKLNQYRAADIDLIKQTFDAQGIKPEKYYKDTVEAFAAAQASACPGDLIVIYGSFYTVGQLMDLQTKSNIIKEMI